MVAAIESLLIKAPEAAKALALSERTLWSLAKKGELPSIKVNRAVRYDLADLRAWIERKKNPAQPATELVMVPSIG
jgi:excisionase family DNA binding protein